MPSPTPCGATPPTCCPACPTRRPPRPGARSATTARAGGSSTGRGRAPGTVRDAGRPVTRPLAPEEDLARALLDALSAQQRAQAVIADTAPDDIISYTRPQAPERTEPLGVPAARLGATGRALLDHLLAVYLDRLPPELAAAETGRLRPAELYLAWAGPGRPGQGHYYRIQGPDLLVEYDNTQDGANHAHTVLRRPVSDFGDDVLARHYATA